MRAKVEKLIADGYDAVADAYQALEGDVPWPWTRRLPLASRVLDLGCGSGLPASRVIVDAGPATVCVDVSPEQIDRARAGTSPRPSSSSGTLDLWVLARKRGPAAQRQTA